MSLILQSERLSLHRLDRGDANFVLNLVTSRGFRENIGDRGINDLKGAEGYIERIQASYEVQGFGLWRCDINDSRQAVGICGFVKRDSLEHPDIGFAFLGQFWGRGYATEAAQACLNYGRQVLKLSTILAITAPHNHVSARVLNKIGLSDVGLRRLAGAKDESRYFST